MATTGRAQSAAAVVRRLNAAVKSRRLYAAGHQLRAQTVAVFLQTVAAFHERYGGFVLETHRDGLILEGKPFEGGESVDSLALLLYSVGVWQLVVMPGISEAELNHLMDVFMMDRDDIIAAGGLPGILTKQQIDHIRVFELRPGEEDPSHISLESYRRLVEGSLSAHERAALLDVMRAGPDQTTRLLMVVVERTKQVYADASGPGLGRRVYDALAALDRLIADAPAADAQDLLRNVVGAVTAIDDPGKVLIHREVLQRAASELSARALLSAMTNEQIARMVIPCLETENPPPQVAQVVNGLPFDPEKARDALALVSQQTGRSFDIPPVLEEVRWPPWIRNIPQDLADFVISEAEVALDDNAIKTLVNEPRVDDVTLRREHAATMLHLVLADEDPGEVKETLAALVADIGALIQQGADDLAGALLQKLDLVADERGPKADLARDALRKLLHDIPSVAPAQEIRGWPDTHPLLTCLRHIARKASTELAQGLRMEKDLVRRQAITAILMRLGDNALNAMLVLLSDPNPDVARPIIGVLVQMRSATAVAALRNVARHPDASIRRDAVAALGAMPLVEAQSALLGFLHDADVQVRETCLRFLKPESVRRIALDLAAMLLERDVVPHTDLRIRIIEQLMRAGAAEVIPQLRKLASPFKVRRRDREIARFARTAVVALIQQPTAAKRLVR